MLSPSQIIVVATPVFLVLMAVEWAISLRRGRNAYALADAISSLNLGILSQTSAVFTKLLTLGIYTAVASHVALIKADAFWMSGHDGQRVYVVPSSDLVVVRMGFSPAVDDIRADQLVTELVGVLGE